MKKIVASILSADFTRLGEELSSVERAGADWIHVDIMDGHFVPNLSMGVGTVEAVRRATSLPIDVHLMIDNPDLFIEPFAKAGATHISVHAESVVHLNRSLALVRSCGAHPGIALGPAASLSMIEWSLEYADFVLLLAVQSRLRRTGLIHPTCWRRSGRCAPSWTGGRCPPSSSPTAASTGKPSAASRQPVVDALVMGSAIFGAADYAATIAELRRRAEGA